MDPGRVVATATGFAMFVVLMLFDEDASTLCGFPRHDCSYAENDNDLYNSKPKAITTKAYHGGRNFRVSNNAPKGLSKALLKENAKQEEAHWTWAPTLAPYVPSSCSEEVKKDCLGDDFETLDGKAMDFDDQEQCNRCVKQHLEQLLNGRTDTRCSMHALWKMCGHNRPPSKNQRAALCEAEVGKTCSQQVQRGEGCEGCVLRHLVSGPKVCPSNDPCSYRFAPGNPTTSAK